MSQKRAAAAGCGNDLGRAAEENTIGWLHFSQSRPGANPQLHQAAALLHSMDQSLTCFLCGDIYQIPVSIQPCHHAFCNGCIRNHWAANAAKTHQEAGAAPAPVQDPRRCPICQTPLDDSIDLSKSIVLNRSFEETARHYKTLRPLLKTALAARSQAFTTAASSHHHLSPQSPQRGGGVGVRRTITQAAAAEVLASAVALRNRGDNDDDYNGGLDHHTDGRGVANNPNQKKRGNSWIREQFVIEWTESKQTWSFVCCHCKKVGLRSREKKWNVSKLTEHIISKCPDASAEMKSEAISHTQGAKRVKRLEQEAGGKDDSEE